MKMEGCPLVTIKCTIVFTEIFFAVTKFIILVLWEESSKELRQHYFLWDNRPLWKYFITLQFQKIWKNTNYSKPSASIRE